MAYCIAMDLVLSSIISLNIISACCNIISSDRIKHEVKDNYDGSGYKPTDILAYIDSSVTAKKSTRKKHISNNGTGYRKMPDKTSSMPSKTPICITVTESVDSNYEFAKLYKDELKKSLYESIKHIHLTESTFNGTGGKGIVVLAPKDVNEIELEFITVQREHFEGRVVTVFLFKIPKITITYSFALSIKSIGNMSGEVDIVLLNQIVNTKFIPTMYDTGKKCYHQMPTYFTFNVEDYKVYYQIDKTTIKEKWWIFGKKVINTLVHKRLGVHLENVIIKQAHNATVRYINSSPSSLSRNGGIQKGGTPPFKVESNFVICSTSNVTRRFKPSGFADKYMKVLRDLLQNSTNHLFVNNVNFNNSQAIGKIRLIPILVSNIKLEYIETEKEHASGIYNVFYSYKVPEITFKYRYQLEINKLGIMSGTMDINLFNKDVFAKFLPVADGKGYCYKQQMHLLTFTVSEYEVHYFMDKNVTMKADLHVLGKKIINTLINDLLCGLFENAVMGQLAKVHVNKSTGTPEMIVTEDIPTQSPLMFEEPQGPTVYPAYPTVGDSNDKLVSRKD